MANKRKPAKKKKPASKKKAAKQARKPRARRRRLALEIIYPGTPVGPGTDST